MDKVLAGWRVIAARRCLQGRHATDAAALAGYRSQFRWPSLGLPPLADVLADGHHGGACGAEHSGLDFLQGAWKMPFFPCFLHVFWKVPQTPKNGEEGPPPFLVFWAKHQNRRRGTPGLFFAVFARIQKGVTLHQK